MEQCEGVSETNEWSLASPTTKWNVKNSRFSHFDGRQCVDEATLRFFRRDVGERAVGTHPSAWQRSSNLTFDRAESHGSKGGFRTVKHILCNPTRCLRVLES